ncbi:hypothetical protein ACUY2G_03295 [Corynebacterium guaraldiae]|uniref:hypothetical protein n=1 Tax=Corynebacterium TaxID=1716 RepID=UPI0008A4FD90|nr:MULTISPECIES: hypothetical protein [Corynebacterium]MBE7338042.1 hypothetical protein [Corynebacterium aurimucosum]MBE7363841.1 hypothetical protein [Corynebacterium aurimucosum]MCZ9298909.1 hypothetical protein [Corynebacterium hesseae]MDK6808089.1 hypothetical protein [Corynebacterium aurimucosum]MDK8897330.1 hypothetical protein [Corynebacterium sp. MSK004]
MTSPKQDNYALDDTLAGRITQAAAVGIMTAFPDWIKNKTALVFAYVLSFLGFGALVAITNAESHEDRPEPETPDVPVWAIPVAFAILVLGGWITVKTEQSVVRFIRRRGAAKPWTVWGGISAAIVLILSELEARELTARN